MIVAILASGPSMSQAVADSVRGRCKVIAVSDAYRLAPWADCLVSTDTAWWRHHKPEFSGLRFSSSEAHGTQSIKGISSQTNSGAMAIRVAMTLGATEIILLGFDGHGTHFFGSHPKGLKDTTEQRRRVHMVQHRLAAQDCKRAGVTVWNCTPGTVIDAYPIKTLEEVLC